MSKFNFQEYFGETENAYYDVKYIITILERMLETNFEEIKANVNDAKILLSEEEIRAYLEQKLIEEDPELKQRVETRRLEQEKIMEERRKKIEEGKKEELSLGDFGKMTEEERKEDSQAFADNYSMQRYQFEPYTLKYFNKYVGIVREKLLILLNIVEQISNRNVDSIQDLMIDLDIILDENGNISKEDIVRLITPIIYNLADLNKKVEQANELSTYLTFKMSKHSLMREGFSEGEVYPQKTLQDKSMFGFNGKQNIQLSKRQEQERREKQKRNIKASVKILSRLK